MKDSDRNNKNNHNYAPINVIPGERGGGGGRAGMGILTFCPKFLSKTTPPGQCILSKKHKNPHPRAGELCQMFLPRGNAIHSRHPPRPNQTKKLYVAKL